MSPIYCVSRDLPCVLVMFSDEGHSLLSRLTKNHFTTIQDTDNLVAGCPIGLDL